MPARSSFFGTAREDLRAVVRQFVDREVVPHLEEFDEQHIMDRATWLAAGKQGCLASGSLKDWAVPVLVARGLRQWTRRSGRCRTRPAGGTARSAGSTAPELAARYVDIAEHTVGLPP